MIWDDKRLQRAISALSDVTMYGYPKPTRDVVNRIPIACWGMTAYPPWINYNPCEQFLDLCTLNATLPIGLVDISAFHGSSGSPIFYFDLPVGVGLTLRDKDGQERAPSTLLLGVVARMFLLDQQNIMQVLPIPNITNSSLLLSFVNPYELHLGLYWRATALFDIKPLLPPKRADNGVCSQSECVTP